MLATHITKTGEIMQISDMTDGHLHNTIKFLLAKAEAEATTYVEARKILAGMSPYLVEAFLRDLPTHSVRGGINNLIERIGWADGQDAPEWADGQDAREMYE